MLLTKTSSLRDRKKNLKTQSQVNGVKGFFF